MDAQTKKLWLEALRSDEYKQCTERLATNTGFCCLGVLYDVIADDYWERDSEGEWCVRGAYESMPPNEFLNSIGLDRDDAMYLAKLNDSGKTFAQIANAIEKEIW